MIRRSSFVFARTNARALFHPCCLPFRHVLYLNDNHEVKDCVMICIPHPRGVAQQHPVKQNITSALCSSLLRGPCVKGRAVLSAKQGASALGPDIEGFRLLCSWHWHLPHFVFSCTFMMTVWWHRWCTARRHFPLPHGGSTWFSETTASSVAA